MPPQYRIQAAHSFISSLRGLERVLASYIGLLLDWIEGQRWDGTRLPLHLGSGKRATSSLGWTLVGGGLKNQREANRSEKNDRKSRPHICYLNTPEQARGEGMGSQSERSCSTIYHPQLCTFVRIRRYHTDTRPDVPAGPRKDRLYDSRCQGTWSSNFDQYGCYSVGRSVE